MTRKRASLARALLAGRSSSSSSSKVSRNTSHAKRVSIDPSTYGVQSAPEAMQHTPTTLDVDGSSRLAARAAANAHAAVALLAACAEEALHRVKAHPPEVTRAAQDLLDDVTWTLQAVACSGDTSGVIEADRRILVYIFQDVAVHICLYSFHYFFEACGVLSEA